MDALSRLRQVDFLAHLPPKHLRNLASICALKRYRAGELIIEQGDITNRFCVVDEGYVHFRRTDLEGFEHSAGDARPGQFFGKQMFTSQELAAYTAEALGEATVYEIRREEFDQLVEREPNLLNALPHIVSERHKFSHGFAWLTPGEVVVLTLHRNRWALALTLRSPALVLILLLGLLFGVSYFGLPAVIFEAVILAGGIVFLALLTWDTYDWVNDDFIVTNRRVAHTERVLLRNELRETIPIDQVQSVKTMTGGPLSVMLGISSLEVRAAGRDDSRVVFDRIANADQIKILIFQQLGVVQARERAQQREAFRGRVVRQLRRYILQQPAAQDDEPEVDKPVPRISLWKHINRLMNHLFGTEVRAGNLIIWRKHPFILLQQTGRWLLAIALIGLVVLAYLMVPAFAIIPRTGFFAVILIFLVVALGGALWQFDDWRNDIYAVNDTEVIDVERLPFRLHEKSITAPLSKVQDVKAFMPSVVNTLFEFGQVQVQVAGAGEPLTFYHVAHPQQIVEEIMRRIEVDRLRKADHQRALQSQDFVDALVAYHRLIVQERKGPRADAIVESVTLTTGTQTALPSGESHTEAEDAQSDLDTLPHPETLSEFPPADEVE
jgi:CRP-like cAMP-binding protein/membrane protein YdbS with pleckstrin-like domain